MCRPQRITGHLRSHGAIPQDDRRQDREHGVARGTLETPEADPAETDPDLMCVSGPTPTPATGRLVGELDAQSEQAGQGPLDKRLPLAKQAHVGRFIVEIAGDGPVLPRPCGCWVHCVTSRSPGEAPHICSDCGLKSDVVCESAAHCLRAVTPMVRSRNTSARDGIGYLPPTTVKKCDTDSTPGKNSPPSPPPHNPQNRRPSCPFWPGDPVGWQ